MKREPSHDNPSQKSNGSPPIQCTNSRKKNIISKQRMKVCTPNQSKTQWVPCCKSQLVMKITRVTLMDYEGVTVSKDEGSKNKTLDTRMPYYHPNLKSHCITQQLTKDEINTRI
jgi:hypothetical protein